MSPQPSDAYPADVPVELPPLPYQSLADLLTDAFAKYERRRALQFMGHAVTFGELDHMAHAFASFLQSRKIYPGERVALM